MTESQSEPEVAKNGDEHPPGGSGVVFVCDASAEAERLMGALRSRGYAVVDVPLGLLANRVRYETPELVVVDADAHEATRHLVETREASPVPLRLVLLGSPDGALARDPALAASATLVFVRPIDISRTADSLRESLGPAIGASGRPYLARGRGPMLVASARRPYRTDNSPAIRSSPRSIEPVESHWPGSPQLLPLLPDMPSLGELPPISRAPHSSTPPSAPHGGTTNLSPETRTLLDQARRRVASNPSQMSRPLRLGAEQHDHRVVSADLLAALSEPLGANEVVAPEDPVTRAGDTSGGVAGRQPTRATETSSANDGASNPGPSDFPSDDEDEETNPGGRPGSRGAEKPHSEAPPGATTAGGVTNAGAASTPPGAATPGTALPGTALPSTAIPGAAVPEGSHEARAPMLSLPPLDDLSDLLAIPPARMHTRPMPSETPSAFPSESPANDAPSTAPGGRRRESASYQDEPTRERVPAPPSVHPPSGNGPKSVATSPDLAPASLPAQHKEPAASKEPAVSREPAAPSPAAPELAHVTFEGNPLERLAMAIRERWSGALAQQTSGGIRRVVLRDGDFSTLTSSAESESLVQFLVTRGDLSQDAAATLRNLPRFGRHAGAALVAQGTLRQEDLWGVLRGHAEWLLGLILGSPEQLIVDQNTPQRLLEEPTAFGGAAGAEVYVDVLRRILNPADAFTRLGAGQLELGWGAHQSLLAETGLPADLERQLPGALSQSLTRVRDKTPQMLVVLCALTELGVLSTGGGRRPTPAPEALKERSAEMDDEAFANQVRSRRSLVEEGDYFSILGIARSATRYEVDRACEHWRREFDSARVTARNAHLVPDLELVLAVVEEARLVLSDDVRRERYRKALDLF